MRLPPSNLKLRRRRGKCAFVVSHNHFVANDGNGNCHDVGESLHLTAKFTVRQNIAFFKRDAFRRKEALCKRALWSERNYIHDNFAVHVASPSSILSRSLYTYSALVSENM